MSAKCQKRTYDKLFDHVVGDGKHARRNGEAERLGSREVDDKLEFGRLQHRQVSGLGALKDTRNVPLVTPKRALHMSALGQKQTSEGVCAMSALPPEADIVEG